MKGIPFRKSSRCLKLVFGLGAGLAIAAPSCVPVSAPTATGSFIACYKECGGAVRFINAGEACDQGEKQATWNQTGPQGVPGVNGNGPAYHDNGVGGASIQAPATLAVASIDPPAGTYAIDFTATVNRYLNNAPSNKDRITCKLVNNANIGDGPVLYSSAAGGILAWHDVLTHPGGSLYMACSAEGYPNNRYDFFNVDLTATKITEIIEQ